MAVLDDAIFNGVQSLVSNIIRYVKTDTFKLFLLRNKRAILSGYRIPHKTHTPELLQTAIVNRLTEAMDSVRGLGVQMALVAANNSVITSAGGDQSYQLIRSSTKIIAELGSQIPQDEILKSEYLKALFVNIIYQYVLFVASSIAHIDDDSLDDAEDVKNELLVKLILQGMIFELGISKLAMPTDEKEKKTIMFLFNSFSRPYSVYGDMDLSKAFWSMDMEVKEHESEEMADYMILALEEELRWLIVKDALDIIRDGDILYQPRKDSRGKVFEYTSTEPTEESDKNSIALFLVYRAMAIPFTRVLNDMVRVMMSDFPNTKPKPIDSAAVDRAYRILKHEPIKGSGRRYPKLKEQIAIASKHIAAAVVSNLAERTRQVHISAAELGSTSGKMAHVRTPFLRLFAVFNNEICTTWNFDSSNEMETRLDTSWEILQKVSTPPPPPVDNPGAKISDGTDQTFSKDEETKAPPEAEEPEIKQEQQAPETTQVVNSAVDNFFNECAGELLKGSE